MNRRHLAIALLALGALLCVTGGGALVVGSGVSCSPSVNPFDPGKLQVLIVEESSLRTKLPVGQLAVFDAARKYAKDHGGECRVLDTDDDVSGDLPWVRQAMAKSRQSLPWWVVGSRSEPLPKSEAEALMTLQRIGGK